MLCDVLILYKYAECQNFLLILLAHYNAGKNISQDHSIKSPKHPRKDTVENSQRN